ncbi:DUF4147 domain-containing protein [Nitrososphaera sp.]|uniref:glycerate kinase type-2 family protein n=1 Tax=Nitrososphaera sp. TaxID=1971748 RepID=UPI00307EBC16
MIRNRAELEEFHGREAGIVLGALDAAIKSVEPGRLVRRAMKFDGTNGHLVVRDIAGDSVRRFEGFKDVYIVGAGKATAAMADAACSILKGRVAGGAINVPRDGAGDRINDRRIQVTHASHPIPDRSGLKGAKRIVDVVRSAGDDDLVLVLISGGGSALMPLPAKGLTIADKQEMTSRLLASGVSIQEVNVVRKHLSAVKGGRLVQGARCTIVSLVLSDVIGDDLGSIASGPTSPDPSTFADAARIIKKYRIAGPAAAIRHLSKGAGGLIEETPKPGDPAFGRVHNFIIGNNELACRAAVAYLKRRGVNARYLGSDFAGDAARFGRQMAGIACPAVAGGETTVRLGRQKKRGKGGRNQEAALAFALAGRRKKGSEAIAGFIGTDGIDGNSDAAGAIISKRSMLLSEKIDAKKFLAEHDSYHALKKIKSLIFTGRTGTNVNDVAAVVLLRRADTATTTTTAAAGDHDIA